MSSKDIIAWLVPTAYGTPADEATNSPPNALRSTSAPPNISSLGPFAPKRAIQLSFGQLPNQPGSFTLGSDSRCDVVLPPLQGIAPRHCALRFDAEARLMLDDFSGCGTAVWYDWESSGDQRDYSWVLSSGYSHGFPNSTVQRIIIDIQGVRFQVVVNDHSADWDAYKAKVDTFNSRPPWMNCANVAWDMVSTAAPLFSEASLIQHVFVKGLGTGSESIGEIYLWNMARPWEPMVRAAA